MIAFALAVWTFLRGNWTWALPVLLLIGVGIDDGRLRISNANLRASLATDEKVQADNIAKAQAEVRKALQADIDHGNEVVAKYAGEIAGLQGDIQDAQIKLAKAENNPVCNRTPVTDAFDSGVQSLWDRSRKANSLSPTGK